MSTDPSAPGEHRATPIQPMSGEVATPPREPGVTRRQVLAGAAALVAVGVIPGGRARARAAEAIALPPLPYPENALDPYISGRTLGFHYGKHQQGYIDKCNQLLAGSDLAGEPLAKIVTATASDPTRTALFHAAAQAWNHDLYFNSMRPKGGGAPTGNVADRIAADFGDYAGFRKAFSDAATTQFGSGWTWLVANGGELRVENTDNAGTPITSGATPLLTLDVWEHAYYLDYQNRRAEYVAAWLDHLVNWEFAAANLDRAR